MNPWIILACLCFAFLAGNAWVNFFEEHERAERLVRSSGYWERACTYWAERNDSLKAKVAQCEAEIARLKLRIERDDESCSRIVQAFVQSRKRIEALEDELTRIRAAATKRTPDARRTRP